MALWWLIVVKNQETNGWSEELKNWTQNIKRTHDWNIKFIIVNIGTTIIIYTLLFALLTHC